MPLGLWLFLIKGNTMKVDLVIRNGLVITEDGETGMDLAIANGRIVAMGNLEWCNGVIEDINASGLAVFPGLVDTHVHFREPEPTVEEDFSTGSRAAAAGGVTTVFDQPVNEPPTVTVERFLEKKSLAQEKSYIDFGLWAGVIAGNLEQLPFLYEAGACGFKAFMCSSDPHYPMIGDGELLEAMRSIRKIKSFIAVHAESQSIIDSHTRKFASFEKVNPRDYVFSRPIIAEVEAIQRAILLAEEAGVHLHILHLSSAAGAEAVAKARKAGVWVTSETCPHYLVLDETALERYGPYAKCNPPLRDANNREKLWKLLTDGEIQCVVSDHSPYTTEDKRKGLDDIRLAPPGINALELGLPLLIHSAYHTGRVSLAQLARWMSTEPARLIGVYPRKGCIRVGADADVVLVNLDKEWTITQDQLHTKNKWSPFIGWTIRGKVVQTLVRGRTVYRDGQFPMGPGYGTFINPREYVAGR